MQQTVAPPESLWHAVWPAVQPVLTPSTLGAMALTIFVTHAIKSLAASLTDIDKSRDGWIAFCTVLSMLVGCFVGVSFWLAGWSSGVLILITTFGSGPVWRLCQALLPAKIADILLTAPDRYWRDK